MYSKTLFDRGLKGFAATAVIVTALIFSGLASAKNLADAQHDCNRGNPLFTKMTACMNKYDFSGDQYVEYINALNSMVKSGEMSDGQAKMALVKYKHDMELAKQQRWQEASRGMMALSAQLLEQSRPQMPQMRTPVNCHGYGNSWSCW